MKRNIGYIELIVVLCLVIIAVRAWTYKKSEKELSEHTPTIKSSHPTYTPTQIIDFLDNNYVVVLDNESGPAILRCPNCNKKLTGETINSKVEDCLKGRVLYYRCLYCNCEFISRVEMFSKFVASVILLDNIEKLTMDEWKEFLNKDN